MYGIYVFFSLLLYTTPFVFCTLHFALRISLTQLRSLFHSYLYVSAPFQSPVPQKVRLIIYIYLYIIYFNYNFYFPRIFRSLTYVAILSEATLFLQSEEREGSRFILRSFEPIWIVLIERLKLIAWISLSRHCYAVLEIYRV